jgi:hypothetical protein
MRHLTTRALSWLQTRRARADDSGFTTAEALTLGAIGVLAIVLVVQPRLTDILNSVLDSIQDALP